MTRGYLALLAFVALLGALSALWLQDTRSRSSAPDGIQREGIQGEEQHSMGTLRDPVPAAGPDDLVDASDPRRVDPDVDETSAAQPVRVQVTDAVTGGLVRRFWVRPAGLQDMASGVGRVISEPGAAEVVVAKDAWPSSDDPRFILVSAPMYQPQELPAEQAIIKVALLRASGIVGVVRDGNSAALPFAEVRLEALDPALPQDPQPISFPESYSGPTLRKTDATGAFAFSAVPAGLYRTQVSRDGSSQTSAPILVRPGEWAHSDHWLDERARLAVVLSTALGEPAPKSRISIYAAEGDGKVTDDTSVIASRYTDEDGRATLGPLPAGSYRVIVLSDQGQAEPAPLTISEDSHPIEELRIQLSDK